MRIVSLQPSISLILSALGRLDTLCACTRYCLEALPELSSQNLPILQDSWSFDKSSNIETLLTTQPEIVIASVPYRVESLAAILKCGLPVLALAPRSLADIQKDIRLIGSIANAIPEAEILVAQISEAFDQMRDRVANAPIKPLVYSEEWGKPLIHSQRWVAEMVETAGGTFLGEPGTHTTPEAIASLPESQQPDVLLFAWCGAGNRVPLERVIDQRSWHHLRAVRNRRVFCVPDELFNTPAPNLIQGLACIASTLHPGLFPLHSALIQLEEVPLPR